MSIVKVLVDPKKPTFLLREHVGTVDLTPVGLGICNMSVSGACVMVEFNDRTIIGLDVQEFVKECISVYNDLKNKKEAISHE